MLEHAYLIPLIPLVASLVILLGFKEDSRSPAPYLGIAAMLWCLAQSCAIFYRIATAGVQTPYEANITWFGLAADFGGQALFPMQIGVLIDGPAAVMLCVVTLVSALVQIYSLGYMRDDPRFRRYFAFLSFFTAAMLGLVVSSNLLVTFMCWELVGVSSYLLIGFWFEKPGPAYASKKAFITTKLGDCGLYVALLLIFDKAQTFQISSLQQSVAHGYHLSGAAATAVGLGLLAGAIGKSAQWPLFIWLPDAMEGPTPVSALIHAATMVAAGIYLVARTYFIYQASPVALEAVAWIGLTTAFLAATMALVAYDIKRVLAFSTVSQLGFMMCALGAGGYAAGLFHLTTHAFFKALLFLGAGSVIHAVHSNDMRQMGGLSKKMPVTFVTMGLATLAIAGVPPLSGYFSKEMILEVVYEHSPAMFALLSLSALLTAFYMTRMMMLTFLGEARDHERHRHAHESPLTMTGPLMLLAALSAFAGMALARRGFIAHLLSLPAAEGAVESARHFPEGFGYAVTALAILSMAASYLLYRGPRFAAAEAIKRRFSLVFDLLEQRYGFDAFFLWLVDLSDALARFCFWFDSEVVDRIFVDGWGLLMQIWAQASQLFDFRVIDKTVDGFGGLSLDLGVGLRSLVRAGQVQEYLMYIAIAVSLFATLILTR